jgi:hypothetical protein
MNFWKCDKCGIEYPSNSRRIGFTPFVCMKCREDKKQYHIAVDPSEWYGG